MRIIKIKTQIFAIIVLSLLLMGVSALEGCTQTSSQSGLDFSLESGLDKMSSGRTISQGELFYVTVNIDNYDSNEKTGKICIKDDMDDVYSGIKEECLPFVVAGAEEIDSGKKGILSSGKPQTEPGTAKVNFPFSSEYQYSGLPSTQNAKLIVTAEYSQSSTISSPTGISVPEPSTGVVQLEQNPEPVSISAERSIIKKEGGYKVSLDLQLSKQSDAIIYSSDFKDENYMHISAEMPPKNLECIPEGSYDEKLFEKGLVEIKNKNFIRCSTFVYEEDQTWPLQIKLDYGVKIKKEFPFTIKTD